MPIKPDPRPTCEEIRHFIAMEKRSDQIALDMAELQWKVDQKRKNPDLFLVPFATAIEDYPGRIRSYTGYLRSNLWKMIRERVMARFSGDCLCCEQKATQVHHRDYRPSVLRGEDDSPLVPLCDDCHEKVHNDGDRKRESWNEAEGVLAQMIEQRELQLSSSPQH
jgi:hypothetical protein